MQVLVLNAGSSSLKSALFQLPNETPLWAGSLTGTTLKTTVAGKTTTISVPPAANPTAQLIETLWAGPNPVLTGPQAIQAVGHRVVHGGPDFQTSIRITTQVKDTIQQLVQFAPQHNPAGLAGITALEQLLPTVPQVAVFDTAFHRTLPPAETVYPGPYAWFEQGIRRYGFHGISHEYCANHAAQVLGQAVENLRIVSCHLGNGCSLAAIRGGKSLATTMGFTPLEGLMMGTRSGSIDPGILLHLLRTGLTVDELDHLLYSESGLLGVSGRSGDMREILAARAQGDSRSSLAFEVYIHRLQAQIGAMMAVLGGLDILLFTGGVGENAPEVRAQATAPFAFMGLHLDPVQNARSPQDQNIAQSGSVPVFIIHTREEWAIAQECQRVLSD